MECGCTRSGETPFIVSGLKFLHVYTDYHPSSLCCLVKAVKVKCLSCIGEEKFDCVAVVSYLLTPQ